MPLFSKKLKQQLHQPWFGGGVGATLTILFGLSLLLFPFGKGLQDWSYDLPFLVRGGKPVDDVVILYLNEESYNDLSQDPAMFDRRLHAELVKRLKAEGAKMIVFDVLFIDKKRPITNAEHEFADAMKSYGKVVIGAQYDADEHVGSILLPPIDLFRDAAAGWGIAKINRDSDFGARLINPGTDTVPSMAWAAAETMIAEVTKNPNKRLRERWINYYSPEPFRGFSYSRLLLNKTFPTGFTFREKYVFVGSGDVAGYTGDKKEQYRNPWTWISGHFHLGVELQALTFANLMRQDWLTRPPTSVEMLIIVLTGGLLGYGLSLFRPLTTTGLALLFAALVAAIACFTSIKLNLWFPWAIIVAAQVPLALGWSYLFHSIRTYMETQLLTTSLELYLSPNQVKEILKQPDLLKPGASQKVVSILFSDIANFSKISERMDPDDLVNLLNNYYETSIACVHETDGTVLNLIGDAILAIWNAPQEQKDHQERACRSAVLLHERLVQFSSQQRSLPMRTRVGLHTGVVCVGNIGSTTHFDYAAIGESVNMASRLEGLNKQLGTDILATRDIQKSTDGKLVSRQVGYFRFKGFDQVVEIHELIGQKEIEAETREWRDAFSKALHHFHSKEFDEAETGFRETIQLRKTDGPSKFYLDRIVDFRVKPPESTWLGEVDLREK